MKRNVRGALAGWLVLACVSAAWAYDQMDLQLEWWTGSGDHWAVLVVDFWPGNGASDSFAFGYAFQGDAITGVDLLNGVQAANQGFTYATDQSGFLTDIWYVKGETTYHVTYSWPTSWWEYFNSTTYGEWWDVAFVGPAGRVLHSGESDGWLALPGDDFTSVPVTPTMPQTITGDMNCDGVVNFADINPFVLALGDTSDAYYAAFPTCNRMNADVNHDGHVNFADINPFVALLLGGQ